MRFDRAALERAVGGLPHRLQVLFALLCAERLHPACWAFARNQGVDISRYFSGCELVFDGVVRGLDPSSLHLGRVKDDLDEQVPRSDEHGSPLAVQAQSGMIALVCACDLWLGADARESVEAASAVVDGLDNYQYFLHSSLAGRNITPGEHLLLDRELDWQNRSIDLLHALDPSNRMACSEVRIRNRAYVVPPAV